MIITLASIILPLLVAALIHHGVVIPGNLFPWLAKPIDRGLLFQGRPLFGRTKTWRGLLVMSIGAAVVGGVMSIFLPRENTLNVHPLSGAFLFGLAYSLGELPTSFLKRRLDLDSSAQRHDFLGKSLYILEQADSIVAVSIAALFIVSAQVITWQSILFGTMIGVLLHVSIDGALHYFGYKKTAQKPWYLDERTHH